MTTATQTAAVQEPATSIHEPMETVSEHQRTLYRIKEAQRADRKAAKMKEKAIALAEQQAYDEEARREMQKRQEADRVAYIQLLSERADRTRKEYDEMMSHLVTVLDSEAFAKVSDSEFVSVYQWQTEVNAEYAATQPEQAVDSAKRHLHTARHEKYCRVSRCITEPEDVMKFYSTESTDGRIVTLTVMIDHQMLMMRARAEELQNGIRNMFRAQYDTHQEDVYDTANVAKVLHQVGALKLSSTGGTISIELSAGIGRLALSLDVNLRNYSMTIRTNDGGLAVRPDGHGTVSVVRDRSPYMY